MAFCVEGRLVKGAVWIVTPVVHYTPYLVVSIISIESGLCDSQNGASVAVDAFYEIV
jgi:hypothetical protein